MKTVFTILLLCPFFFFGQIQIGQDIEGDIDDGLGFDTDMSSDGNILATSSLSGNNNVGYVRVFENINNQWIQLGNDINGENEDENFGSSISLSSDGKTIIIGIRDSSINGIDSGEAKIYRYANGIWVQKGNSILGDDSEDRFGGSVSISSDGNIVAISASADDTNGDYSGQVKVFEYINNDWVQLGSAINGSGSFANLGSVSLSSNGNILATGASGFSIGYVQVYEYINSEWIQRGTTIQGETIYDRFGADLSISSDGSILGVSAPNFYYGGENTGYVRVFEFQNNNWIQKGNNIYGETSEDFFGGNIDLSDNGEFIVIAASTNDDNGLDSGKAKLYKLENNEWLHKGEGIEGVNPLDKCGSSVSISSDGTIVSSSSINNSNNGFDSGHIRVYDFSNVLSINEAVNNNFSFYPNPATDSFYIHLENGINFTKASIYNALNQLVLETTNQEVVVSTLPAGTYFVAVETNQGNSFKKLIIE